MSGGKQSMAQGTSKADQPPAVTLQPSARSADTNMREVADSSRDLDLLRVEGEIAKLERQPTIEKIAAYYQKLKDKMEDNNKRKQAPVSPDRIRELDEENAKLEAKAEALERLAWGATFKERGDQQLINLGFGLGYKRAIAEKPLVPTDAEVQEKLGPLYERRKSLKATAEDRREKRKQEEVKRTLAPVHDDPARIAQAAARAGIATRRPMTDFEVAITRDPDAVAPVTDKGGRTFGRNLRPIYGPTTGDPIFYIYESSGYTERYDIYGKYLGSGEIGLETPLIDPIDIIFIGEGLADIAVKGVTMGVKVLAEEAPRVGARMVRNARMATAAATIGTADAVPVLGRGAANGLGETTLKVAGREGTEDAASVISRGAGRDLGGTVQREGVGEITLDLGTEGKQAASGAASRNTGTAAADKAAHAPAPAQQISASTQSPASATPTQASPSVAPAVPAQAGPATAVTPTVAPPPAPTPVPKAAGDVAQALRQRFGGRLIDSNNALEQLINRVRDEALRKQGRGAASELQDVIRLLRDGQVDGKPIARVELVPSSSAGRTPDIRIHFADGTQTSWEVRSITSAPQNRVTPKPDAGLGASGRALAEHGQKRSVTASDIAQAIWSKAKNTASRPSQIASGGTISIHVSAADISRAEIANGVQQIAPTLGAHVERVEITCIGSRASPVDALARDVMVFVRQPNGSYLLTP